MIDYYSLIRSPEIRDFMRMAFPITKLREKWNMIQTAYIPMEVKLEMFKELKKESVLDTNDELSINLQISRYEWLIKNIKNPKKRVIYLLQVLNDVYDPNKKRVVTNIEDCGHFDSFDEVLRWIEERYDNYTFGNEFSCSVIDVSSKQSITLVDEFIISYENCTDVI